MTEIQSERPSMTMTSQKDELFEIDGLLIASIHTDIPLTQLDRWSAKVEALDAFYSIPGVRWVPVGPERSLQKKISRSSARLSPTKPQTQPYLIALAETDPNALGDEHLISLTLSCAVTDDRRVTLHSEPLRLEQLQRPEFRAALSQVLRAGGALTVPSVLDDPLQLQQSDEVPAFEMTRLILARAGLVLQGQGRLPVEGKLHIVTADLRGWTSSSQVAIKPILSSMDEQDGEADKKPNRSFTAVLSRVPHHRHDAFYIAAVNGPATAFHGPFLVTANGTEQEAAELIRGAFGPIQDLTPCQIDAVYRPVLALPRTQARARRFEFGPPLEEGSRVASIIIPLYGDGFFLNCIFYLQRVLHPGYELVVVVDDPQLWPEIYGRIAARQSALTVRITLLQCAENYGYARANNIGFAAAKGDVIFLMNSDVLVTDPAGLDEAAATIRARQASQDLEVIVGFSLLFEDDTIQHIGMEFSRSPLVGDLYVAEHPMKGMPLSLCTGGITREAAAVTGALMGMSARLFQSLGGFDPVYERGDFEDADLCLRARANGAQIILKVRHGLYHLERQSLRQMGDASFREMLTYLNCVSFNQRWNATLSSLIRDHREAPTPVPEKQGSFRVRKRLAPATAAPVDLPPKV